MGKHRNYYELREALAQAGCPLCRLAQQAVQRFLEYLLYEKVNDPKVRSDIRQARGFCNLHAWQMRDQRGALGIAILHRDVLKTVMERVRKVQIPDAQQSIVLPRVRVILGLTTSLPAIADLADDLSPQQSCPACQVRERTEALYVHTLLKYVDDPDIAGAFKRSNGLCLPHFRQTLRQATDEATAGNLIAMQLDIWERLLGELDEFIRKQDYRFRDEGLGAEGDSWIRAIAQISGQRGVHT